MAWGTKPKRVIDMLIEGGLAQGYFNRPHLAEHLSFYLSAFWALVNDRQPDGGGIPFAAIDRYAERYGVTDVDEFDRLLVLVQRLDKALSDYQTEKLKEAESLKPKRR